jgi:hypothetical protein
MIDELKAILPFQNAGVPSTQIIDQIAGASVKMMTDPRDYYQFLEQLGEGSFCKVFKAVY